MSVSFQHEAASSISSFESSDSDEENSSKVHDEDYGMIREKSLTKKMVEIKALQDEIEREIQKLSKYLNDAVISKIRKDAQTIIAIRDEINYINGLMGITKDQTQPQYYFLPTKHADEAVREEILRQAIRTVEQVRKSVVAILGSTLNDNVVMMAHESIIRTILDIQQNIKKTTSSAFEDLQTSMSELQALSLDFWLTTNSSRISPANNTVKRTQSLNG
jgi:hypothetical protein